MKSINSNRSNTSVARRSINSNRSNTSVARRSINSNRSNTSVARASFNNKSTVYYRKLVSNEETEEHIVRLHKEGKNIREIAKAVHKNFTYISVVLRKRLPEEYTGNNTTKRLERSSFFLKKSPLPR